MRRFAVSVVVISVLVATVGCGGTAFVISPSNGTIFVASGTVSLVQLAIVNGNQTTVVTLTNAGSSTTFTFCGNLVGQFSTDRFVTTNYKQGDACDTVVQVFMQAHGTDSWLDEMLG